jgi:hypothetical protein
VDRTLGVLGPRPQQVPYEFKNGVHRRWCNCGAKPAVSQKTLQALVDDAIGRRQRKVQLP